MAEPALEPEVLDAEASEVETEGDRLPVSLGTVQITRPSVPPSREVLMPGAADQVVAGMQAYQELLPQLLTDDDYQAAGNKRFVKKSGWRKIARAFNLSVEIVSLSVERDDDGNPMRAECVARAIAPNGQVSDGDGYCAADEPRFDQRGGRQKLENDLRATATTRAKNRAIADLVGMGEDSAEEVDTRRPPPFETPTAAQEKKAKQTLGDIVGDSQKAAAIWADAVAFSNGVCPKALAVLLGDVAGYVGK